MMKLVNILFMVLFVILFAFITFATYYLWINLSNETSEFEKFQPNVTTQLSSQSTQFYPNMRYKNSLIGYHIESVCNSKKQEEARKAFQRIEEKTILQFVETDHPEIFVACSQIAPDSEMENHFIAGEGGPVEIINATAFSIILLGKISLFRDDTCENPQIATHEILHALGFDHNNNTKSIMYPITKCEQTIDASIIEEINRLYLIEPLPDAAIELIEANKTGFYMNFKVIVANYGIDKVTDSRINLFSDGSLIKSFEIGEIELGAKKSLKITNLRISRKTEEVTFVLETAGGELTEENNIAEITLVES